MAEGLSLPNFIGARVAPDEELGITGLRHTSGHIHEEWLPALNSRSRRVRVYREMSENEPIIAASLFAYELLMRTAGVDVTPADESNESLAAAEWLRGAILEDMSHSWDEFLSEAMSHLVYGWVWFEIVYKRRLGEHRLPSRHSRFDDGRWGYRKFAIRAQDTLHRWYLDEEGGVHAMQQFDAMGGRGVLPPIPIEKSLLFRLRQHKGSPEGRSLLRSVYVPWYCKKHIQTILNIGIERDLAGLPLIGVPARLLMANASAADKALLEEFKKVGQNIRRDEQECVIYPLEYDASGRELYRIGRFESGGQRQFDVPAVMKQYNLEMLLAMLTDVIMLGHERIGTQALGRQKANFLGLGLEAILDGIFEVLNRHALPRLWRLNGFPPETQPTLTHGDIEEVDLNELGNFILRLAQANFDLSGIEVQQEVWRRAGFPQPKDTSMDLPRGEPVEEVDAA